MPNHTPVLISIVEAYPALFLQAIAIRHEKKAPQAALLVKPSPNYITMILLPFSSD